MVTLYEIDERWKAFNEMLDERQGDITGIEDEIDKIITDLEGDTKDKIDSCIYFIREMYAKEACRREEAKRLTESADACGTRASGVKDRLLQFMRLRGISKHQGKFDATIAKNGGVLPLDIWKDAKDFDKRYQKIEIGLNREEIRNALLAGEEVAGACFMERGEHLRIR